VRLGTPRRWRALLKCRMDKHDKRHNPKHATKHDAAHPVAPSTADLPLNKEPVGDADLRPIPKAKEGMKRRPFAGN
jgi:hypothetical protein